MYDGQNAWADYSVSGAAVARYLPGDRSDELLARWRAADGVAWYLQDRMFSVRDITDLHGVAVDHLEYDAFGAVRSETSPAAGDRYKYTGREYDAATGLYHYRARAYDPAAGRFLQQDPAGFAAGDANLYRYAFNSPTVYRDPSGMTAAVGYSLSLAKVAMQVLGDVDVKVCVSDQSTRIVLTASLGVGGWGVEATAGYVVAPHGIPVPRFGQMAMCVESCAQLYVTAFANGVFGVAALSIGHFGNAASVGTEYAEPLPDLDGPAGLWTLRVSLECGRKKLQAMADGRGPKPGGGGGWTFTASAGGASRSWTTETGAENGKLNRLRQRANQRARSFMNGQRSKTGTDDRIAANAYDTRGGSGRNASAFNNNKPDGMESIRAAMEKDPAFAQWVNDRGVLGIGGSIGPGETRANAAESLARVRSNRRQRS